MWIQRAVLSAKNTGARGGWCAVARRFPQPMDLTSSRAVALWVDGDGEGETLLVHLRDAAGRTANWPVLISFKGWRLCVFRPDRSPPGFDWSKIGGVIFRLEGTPDDVRRSVSESLGSIADHRRILLSAGGGIPPGVSAANVEALRAFPSLRTRTA